MSDADCTPGREPRSVAASFLSTYLFTYLITYSLSLIHLCHQLLSSLLYLTQKINCNDIVNVRYSYLISSNADEVGIFVMDIYKN